MPYTAKSTDRTQRLIDSLGTAYTGKDKFKERDYATKEELIDAWLASNISVLEDIGTGRLKMYSPTDTQVPKLEIRKTTVTSASFTDSTLGVRLETVGEMDRINPSIAGLFPTTPIPAGWNKVVRYTDQSSITRAADAIAENAQYPESTFEWTEAALELQKIGDSIPVARETFLDTGVIRQNIMKLFDINIKLKEDDLMWDGDGVATKITGLYTKAPAFAAGDYAQTIDNCNLWDLLSVMRTIVMKDRRFVPDIAIISPDDALTYKLLKGADGHYILPQILKDKGLDGMTILESSQVTANTLAIGDSRFGNVHEFGLTVEMGYVDAGFTADILTIAARKWSNLLIRNCEANAFLKCTDIAAAITALETP